MAALLEGVAWPPPESHRGQLGGVLGRALGWAGIVGAAAALGGGSGWAGALVWSWLCATGGVFTPKVLALSEQKGLPLILAPMLLAVSPACAPGLLAV